MSVVALFGHGSMSDLSPLCAAQRTSTQSPPPWPVVRVRPHPRLSCPNLKRRLSQGVLGLASFGRAFLFERKTREHLVRCVAPSGNMATGTLLNHQRHG